MITTFSKLIKCMYSSRQQKTLHRILHEECLYTRLKTLTDEYYTAFEVADNDKRQQHFTKMVSEIMILITLWFRNLTPDNNHPAKVRMVMQLGYKLVKHAVMQVHHQAETYLYLIEDLIEKESLSIEWKFFVVHFFNAEILIPSPANNQASFKNKDHKLPDPLFYLKWHFYKTDNKNHVTLSAFPHDVCKTIPGLRSPNKISMLFKPGCHNFTIIIPFGHLRTFLALMRILYQGKRIGCRQNKGLFLFLQAHIAFEGDEKKYSGREFYKIDNETRHNPVLESEIRQILQPLLAHYLPVQTPNEEK